MIYLHNTKFIITFVVQLGNMFNPLKKTSMTKEERKTAYQVINLLLIFKEETKKDYLKQEVDRLVEELEKSLS